ncbi:NAD(P)-binding protein [Sarocladium strictum]
MPCKTPTFTEADMPDLTGYVIIVTGATGGIGSETAKQLALRNARVYIGGRSAEKIELTIKTLKTDSDSTSNLDLHPLRMNLEDLKSVKSAAEEFMRLESRLDILINNAGIMSTPFELTRDGFDRQWQVNYLAPHTLTHYLMPLMLGTAAMAGGVKDRVRVVNVSSDAAWQGPMAINMEDVSLPNEKGARAGWRRYGHSKQALVRDTKSINDRYSSQGVTAYSLHPGIVATNLQSGDQGVFGKVMRPLIKTFAHGTTLEASHNTFFAATSKDAVADAGKFFMPVGVVEGKADVFVQDTAGNDALWELVDMQMRKVLG